MSSPAPQSPNVEEAQVSDPQNNKRITGEDQSNIPHAAKAAETEHPAEGVVNGTHNAGLEIEEAKLEEIGRDNGETKVVGAKTQIDLYTQSKPSEASIVRPTEGQQEEQTSSSLNPADELSQPAQGLSLAEDPQSTISIERERIKSPTPPPPPPKDEKFLSSVTPVQPLSPTASEHQFPSAGKLDDGGDAEYNEKYASSEERGEGFVDDSRSEIQSIMEQFDDGMGGPGAEEIMSPRLEFAQPQLGPIQQYPPRKSSLEPLSHESLLAAQAAASQHEASQTLPPRTSSLPGAPSSPVKNGKAPAVDAPSSPQSHAHVMFKPPPPEPDPEPDLPFDFHRFLEQLRHRTADPVAKFLRSFLLEFGKKQWMVHEQVKIIGDFLEFISKKMAQCEVWRTVSDAEFDNAREGMEKLVMNRLYSQTFSPAIPPPEPVPPGRSRKKGAQQPLPPGRRGQHQEDVERDEVLAQKVRIYKWVSEEHLDIKPVGEKGRKFLLLAQQELLKIKSYRAPRDKVICVLNCCKVIFGYLRSSQSDQSADSFVPLLIYTVLQANPEHLVSNVQYILRFRNQEKLHGEAGYYISSLMGAVQFIENLDRTSLTVSDEEFERNVEAAVSAIAERHTAEEEEQLKALEQQQLLESRPPQHHRQPSPHIHVISEKSSLSKAEVTPRNSLDAERVPPRRRPSSRNGASSSSANAEGDSEDATAVAGLLRTIQRPLSTIGRIFSDTDTTSPSNQPSQPAQTPLPGNTPRLSPQPPVPQQQSSEDGRQPPAQQRMSAEDAAARQASAEAEEARRIQRQEHKVVVETLAGMFPNLDREIIDDVVRMKEGRVGLAVDACLALSNP